MSEHDEIRPVEAPGAPADQIGHGEAPQPASDSDSGHDAVERDLARDVTALVATVDQHSAELDTLNAILMLTIFAFGALAGIVFLQARAIRELNDALPR
jgi:hypothetical protein